MKFYTTSFILPKEEYAEAECEDNLFYDEIENLRFAIADGASNSLYSTNKWSNLLVRDYVVSGSANFLERLKLLRKQWHDEISWAGLSFFESEKARRGDHCTLLGLSFTHLPYAEKGTWEALAIGDSCLFQIRENRLIKSFPVERSRDFDDRPLLISSVPNSITYYPEKILLKGDYQINDLFLLLTDAIASWFLKSYENGEKPWADIEKLAPGADFKEFIFALRKNKLIRDDDVTILRIALKNVELLVV